MGDAHSWINTALFVLSLLATTYFANRNNITKHVEDFAKYAVKVDTMWDAFLKRSVAEGVQRNFLSTNSPVRLAGESAQIIEQFRVELEEYGQTHSDLNERELAMSIQQAFGARLLKDICIPNDIPYGVCLLIATAIAKGGHTLTEILDEFKITPRAQARLDKPADVLPEDAPLPGATDDHKS